MLVDAGPVLSAAKLSFILANMISSNSFASAFNCLLKTNFLLVLALKQVAFNKKNTAATFL